MLCVNQENGFLVSKAFGSDGTCAFTALMTADDSAQIVDMLSIGDTSLIIAAVAFVYSSVFVIKLILQQLGYRS